MNYIAVLLILQLHYLDACLSGFYSDNEIMEQTIIERRLMKNETFKLESGLSKILGLPPQEKRPKRTTPNHAATIFLKDVYDLWERENFNASTLNANPRMVTESDFIMTFMSIFMSKNLEDYTDGRTDEHLIFDLSKAPGESTVIGSELRIFKSRIQSLENYTVTVFDITFHSNKKPEMRYVDSKDVKNKFKGWLEFNVTSTFTSQKEYAPNRGFKISVTKKSNPKQKLRSSEAGIRLFSRDETSQPFLVAFFKYSGAGNEVKVRVTPDFSEQTELREPPTESNYLEGKPATPDHCQIQVLYIHFEELQWHKIIMAPTGYAVYYCNGLCEFPLLNKMNATNHALIQTLAHIMKIPEAPRATCAPTKLGTLNLLHFVTEYSLILKKFKDMIVKDCGCH